MTRTLTFLCISTYFKGNDFLQALKDAGNKVFLITAKKLEDKPWVRNAVDEFFYVEEGEDGTYNMNEIITGLAYVMRTRPIDRVVALDDFDVEKAAHIREYFRIPGMGQTTGRYFRDKLAMRTKALESGILVPGFSALFNDDEINRFIEKYPGPWMIKPRSEASALGIQKLSTAEELWNTIHELGDKRHAYLVEQYKPGDVYHVDSISYNGIVIFSWNSKYLAPPFDVAHGGGIFRSVTVPLDSSEEHALQTLAVDLLKAFGLKHSASHTEVIRCYDDGKYYFLETSSRVGGAHLSEMVDAASGINLWKEWARMETAEAKGENYKLPPVRKEYSGIIISLARQEWPDLSVFNDPEVVWRMNEPYHVGLVVRSKSRDKVLELMDKYAAIVQKKYHASAPAPKKPAH
ncbi:biotin carboxylase [Dyadobacter sp. BE34]|uniref:Biotin carboxylase n=1 Tax=Dyadobacter fermentans TaxID=94254 RepID=A0ABU1R3L4_9BACT|nr:MULTISPECIES: ATPase [Dyadobacter]MDR6808004.1 biotin carboxylase [Dyadobacter fermentans]MDR7046180.1 biotin carboxylase [Dyadobacter sp. BE242]MDR7200493.1 biotin carboxylase [Dyadobacter sp. BE34]MDR7218453.1 biotin carboxylase [Dyadobacter sp. BE31]MDR7266384.1 biotin carboxylase [Dyadobacter sp. BE32]